MRYLFAILLLSGCASTAPHSPAMSKMPPLPPMPTVKDSLTTQVHAKYAQTDFIESIQLPAKTLLLKWDYSDYREGLFFRVYSRPRFAPDSPWTIRGEATTNLFVITADQAQDFFTVSAVNQSYETFAQKP